MNLKIFEKCARKTFYKKFFSQNLFPKFVLQKTVLPAYCLLPDKSAVVVVVGGAAAGACSRVEDNIVDALFGNERA